VLAALDLARAVGHDTTLTLQIAGISQELLDGDAARVTETQATRLIQALWDATDDELFGVGPKPVPRGTFRMMTLGLIHAPDLADALARLVEFIRIGMGLRVELVENDRAVTLTLTLEPQDNTVPDQLIAAIFLAVVHRLAGWLIGRPIQLQSIHLLGANTLNVAEYQHVYGTAPVFGSPVATMVFDSSYLRSPVIQNEGTLAELIRNSPNALLFRQHHRQSASSCVRGILEHSSTPGAVSVDSAARLLCISAQHLRRRLHEEGSSFRQIKEDVLRDEAVDCLVHGRETIDALSQRLGFSEPSAFRRAFRRWTGSPPNSYRHHV
jgi:AraC-like DNA-binding protein